MEKLKIIAGWLQKRGITLYQVGGSVRDEIMGLPVDDIDICVVGGINADQVQGYLEIMVGDYIDKLTSVHGDFPIWIVEIDGEKYEFAMARTERSIGKSHQDFLVEVRDVTIEQDLYRRDLTINAVAKHLLTGMYVDPYDGIHAIKLGVADPVSEAFMEDPLRVYRAARFCSRFKLNPSNKLIDMCLRMEGSTISNERVGKELMKLFKSPGITSQFFWFLKGVDWLKYHFPEVEQCIGVPQPKKHHPEGDVFEHTMHCIDAAKDWHTKAVMLCHDLGKFYTTEIDGIDWRTHQMNGLYLNRDMVQEFKISAHKHEEDSARITRLMLARISFTDHKTIRGIACLVELHMLRALITRHNYPKMVRRTVRKLMQYNLVYGDLVRVIHCDLSGRPPLEAPSIYDLYDELAMWYADDLYASGAMNPIVTGDMLIALGMKQGQELGEMLRKALELQDRGILDEENWKDRLSQAGFHKTIQSLTAPE